MGEFQRSLAIIIGVNKYQHGIKSLETAKYDAEKLDEILRDKNLQDFYDVTLITDDTDIKPTRENILDLLIKTLVEENLTQSDRLLFYFAGHGIARTNENDKEFDGPQGFLVPSDAHYNEPHSLIPMRTVYESLAKLKCRHLLVILDCCFAGAFRWTSTFRSHYTPRKITKAHYQRFTKFHAWQVITSSAYNQEALDFVDNRGKDKTDDKHSPFAQALFKGLEGEADLNGDGVIVAPELYLYLREYVEQQSKEKQTPGLFPLQQHDRGEYIFRIPKRKLNLAETPPLNPDNNPYRGLEPFEEKHSRFFFGRQELITELAQRLNHEAHRLTIVLGASGSGKSSLVKAGLIPHLRQEEEHQWEIIASMRPGEYPFTALARSIWPISGYLSISEKNSLNFIGESLTNYLSQNEKKKINDEERIKTLQKNWSDSSFWGKLLLISDRFSDLQIVCQDAQNITQLKDLRNKIKKSLQQLSNDLKSNSQKLVALINNWTQTHPQTQLLLVIDQFEELITLTRETDTKTNSESEKTWESFLKLLANTLNICPQFHLIITLRSDFETRFLDSALKPYWAKARFTVRPMNSSELREAIERPALERALYFKPANLVDRLIDEVGQMPGALPLLSFTLSELYLKLAKKWQREETQDRALTIDKDFESQGGIAGVLKNRANQEYEKLRFIPFFSVLLILKHEKPKLFIFSLINYLLFLCQSSITMRRVMLRMLTVDKTEVVRRQVPDSELVYPDDEENKRVKLVIECLVNARLIVRGQDTEEPYIEPAHDYLVTGWDKLQDWIKEDGENLALQQRLTPAAKDWQKIRDSYQPKGILDKAQPIINGVDQVFLPVDNLLVKLIRLPFYWIQRLRHAQRQEDSLREKPVQFLWNGDPYLEVLAQEIQKDDKWLNEVESEFVQASIVQKRRNVSWRWRIALTVMVGLSILTLIAEFQRRNALERLAAQIQALVSYSESLLIDDKKLEALIESVRAGIGLVEVKKANNLQVSEEMQLLVTLHNLTQGFQKSNELTSHTDIVSSVNFSPDGNVIVSGSWDGTVKLWHRNGVLQNTLPHSNNTDDNSTTIDSVKINPDANIIASASWDGIVKLWTIDGRFLRTIKNQVGVRDLAFSKNNLIVTGGDDGIMKIWNLDGDLLQTINGHEDYVDSVVFSPDGQKFVSASDDKKIKIWDLDGHLLKTLEGHKESVKSVSFSPDGQLIVSASLDNTIKLWQSNGNLIKTLEGHEDGVWSVKFSPDGTMIASASQDNTIKIWNLNGDLMETLRVDSKTNQGFWDLAFSPNGHNGQTIVAAHDDQLSIGTITLWKNQNSSLLQLKGHNSLIVNAVFSQNNQTIATASWDNTVKLWKRDGTLINTLKHADSVESVSFNPNGQLIVSVSHDNNIYIWNNRGNLLKKFKAHNAEIYDVVFSPDGQLIASASQDNTVKLWKPDGSLVKVIKAHNNAVNSVSFSPDGQLIASASWDNTVKLWKRDGTLIDELTEHNRSVLDVSFSPDGKILASASEDNTIGLWKVNQNHSTTFLKPIAPDCSSEQYSSPFGSGGALGISFSPDSQLIAVTCGDNQIQIWKVNSRTKLITLKGHKEADFWGVSFSSDWQTLVAGSGDNTVTVWDFTLNNLLIRACNMVGDYLHNSVNVSESDHHLCDDLLPEK